MFEVKMTGVKEVDMMLRRVANTKERLPEFWNMCRQYTMRQINKNFRGEHDPDGTPWKPLTELAIMTRRRGRKGAASRGAQILSDTGRLRKSIGSRMHGTYDMEFFTNLVYAATHQFGRVFKCTRAMAWAIAFKAFNFKWNKTNRKEATGAKQIKGDAVFDLAMKLMGRIFTVPARPFMGFSSTDADNLTKIWRRWFNNVLKTGG